MQDKIAGNFCHVHYGAYFFSKHINFFLHVLGVYFGEKRTSAK